MKKFLDDLRRELNQRNVKQSDIAEILSDHEEMIQTALAEGLEESEIVSRFGDPAKLAEDLCDSNGVEPVPAETIEGYELWKSFSNLGESIIGEIRLIEEDLVIQTGDHDDIRIYRHGKGDVDKYIASFQHGLFTFKSPKKLGLFSFHSGDLRFLIELPKRLMVADLGFGIVSGDATFLNLTTDSLTLDTTSGDLSLQNIHAETARWNTVSGDLTVAGATFQSLSSSQVSGDVHLSNVHVSQFMKIHTVSGDAHIEHSDCDECELESVSGDVNGIEFYPKRLSVRSLSGDIDLKNSEPGRVQIMSQRTMSGEIRIK